MLNIINKNLFKLTFIFLVFVELLSFFGWLLPEFGIVCFFVILLLTLILSLKNLEYGLYILFAELFIGSKGYLFSLEIGEALVSIRIGLFLIVMAVFIKNVILRAKPEGSRSSQKDASNKILSIFQGIPRPAILAGLGMTSRKFRMTDFL